MIPVTRETLIAETRLALAIAMKQRNAKGIGECTDLLNRLGNEKFTEQDDEAIKLLAQIDSVPTALYRHFDEDGRLLYIGISMTITGRTAQHETYAPWFLQIKTIDVQWLGSRSAAVHAEKQAIKTEKPLYNVIHNKAGKHAAKEPKARTIRPRTRKRPERYTGL